MNYPPTLPTKADVLVVDDTPENLQLLCKILKSNGYKARPLPSAMLALDAINAVPPDIILLDIRMPEVDGFEVCIRLKANPNTAGIPIIFISALDDIEDKVRGFQLGAVDYITKPFEEREVLVRLENQLTILHQKRELTRQFEELKKLEKMRATFTNMIIHDISNPLLLIMLSARSLLTKNSLDSSDYSKEYLTTINTNAHTIQNFIQEILTIARLESSDIQLQKQALDLTTLCNEIAADTTLLLKEKKLTFIHRVAHDTRLIDADVKLLRRVILNLVENAIKYSPEIGTIELIAENIPRGVMVSVTDQGPGVPAEYHQTIFETFRQVKNEYHYEQHSFGLGLAFCRLVIQAHGGTIAVANNTVQGATFSFTLPCNSIAHSP